MNVNPINPNCTKCGVTKTDENTYRYPVSSAKKSMRGKLSSTCRKCQCKRTSKWNQDNREKYLAGINRREERFYRLIHFIKAERPCYDCGGMFPPECMDFDHLRDKKFTIGQATCRPLEELRQEIDKCQLVCSNCHRVRTKNRNADKRIAEKVNLVCP